MSKSAQDTNGTVQSNRILKIDRDTNATIQSNIILKVLEILTKQSHQTEF